MFSQQCNGCVYLRPPPHLPVKSLYPPRSPGSSSLYYPSEPSRSSWCDSHCDSCALCQDRWLVGQGSVSTAIIHLHSWELVTNLSTWSVSLESGFGDSPHRRKERRAPARRDRRNWSMARLPWVDCLFWDGWHHVKKSQKQCHLDSRFLEFIIESLEDQTSAGKRVRASSSKTSILGKKIPRRISDACRLRRVVSKENSPQPAPWKMSITEWSWKY